MKRIFAYFDEQMISMRRIELSEFQINVAGGGRGGDQEMEPFSRKYGLRHGHVGEKN